MSKKWFKPKRYGIGFYPNTWQGLLATLGFILIILMAAYSRGMFDVENRDAEYITKSGVGFLFDIVIIAILFSLVFVSKLDGKLDWRWGRKK